MANGSHAGDLSGGRPTVRDLAREAGVSLATVDRVLNHRTGVRQSTVRRVQDAINRIGYTRDIAAANLSKRREYRLVFLLTEGANTFMRMLESEVRTLAARASLNRTSILMRTVPPFDAAALVAQLDKIEPSDVDGVAVVATDAPAVRDALTRLAARGVKVITLVSDAPNSGRARFVGVDNLVAGRTAGGLVGRFCHKPGKIQIVVGSLLLRDHMERRLGFESVLAEDFPHLQPLQPIEGRDDPDIVARLLTEALSVQDGIVGVYSLGAGNRGVIRALEATGRKDLKVVTHELTQYARQALLQGQFDAVINQDVGHEVRSAVRTLVALLDGSTLIDGQERIKVDIFMRDNLP